MNLRIVIEGLLVTIVLLLLPASSHACPGCWSAASGSGNALAGGWFWSFLVLLSLPAALVLSIGGWLLHQSRRARRSALEESKYLVSSSAKEVLN